jgi:hypothetical protein
VVRGLAKLDLPHVDRRFTIVHNTLQFLNNQPGVKRVEYPREFKKALLWICKEGVPTLKSIKEIRTLENLPSDVFTGFDDFMNCLDDGSFTTESTSSWSFATEDTSILADEAELEDLLATPV